MERAKVDVAMAKTDVVMVETKRGALIEARPMTSDLNAWGTSFGEAASH
jgi:hypothetical protein